MNKIFAPKFVVLFAFVALFTGFTSLADRLLSVQQAASGTGTPTLILNKINTQYNSGGNTANTTATAPTGSLIVLFIYNDTGGSQSISACSDSAGNSYTQAATSNPGGSYYAGSLWYVSNATSLPSGGYFTCSTSTGKYSIAAAYVTNANSGLDVSTGNNANSTTVSVASGTLAQANEVVFAGLSIGALLGTFTEGAGFTSLTSGLSPSSYGDFVYKITSSTSGVTYSPSWVNTVVVTAPMASFK